MSYLRAHEVGMNTGMGAVPSIVVDFSRQDLLANEHVKNYCRHRR